MACGSAPSSSSSSLRASGRIRARRRHPRDDRFAVAPGIAIYNDRDTLLLADATTGAVRLEISHVGMNPQVAPNVKFVLYARYEYPPARPVTSNMPFIAPLPAGKPSRRLDVDFVDGENMKLTRDGATLYTNSQFAPKGGCLAQTTSRMRSSNGRSERSRTERPCMRRGSISPTARKSPRSS